MEYLLIFASLSARSPCLLYRVLASGEDRVEEVSVLGFDPSEYGVDILSGLDRHEGFAVFFDARESVEILDQVLAALEDSFSVLGLDQEVAVPVHDCKDLAQGW